MLTQFILAVTTLPATAPAAADPGPTLMQDLFSGAMIAWLVVAIVALIKTQVFDARPLKKAPARPASLLVLVAFGTVWVLFVFQIIAFGIGYAADVLPKPQPAATMPATTAATDAATSSMPAATASTNEASLPAPVENAPELKMPPLDPKQEMWANVLNLGAEAITVAIALLFCRVLFRDGMRGMGLTIRSIPRGVALGTLAILILYPLLEADMEILLRIYVRLNHQMSVHPTVEAMQTSAQEGGPAFYIRLVSALVAGCGAPVVEEIFFRGIVQTTLIQPGWGFILSLPANRSLRSTYAPPPPAYQRWGAILITSALFSMVHQLDQAPILFLLSVGLGYTYERTGNLWASMTLHALFNWATLLPLLIQGN